MRMQPRQQLLEIWRAVARASYPDGKWVWGGRDLTNSISDAEQLLCLMLPATTVEPFKLDRPNETADDIVAALRELGDTVEIPRLLVRVLSEYMDRYTDASGAPVFAGESYFSCVDPDATPTGAQAAMDVVDSFAMSVTLSLATIGFVRVFRTQLTRDDLMAEVDALEAKASRRLSAAMVGLLRSFTVYFFEADSAAGRALVRTANQNGLPERRVVDDLRRALREISAALREVTIGSGSGQVPDLDNPNRLFECGWSWGVVGNAPRIETTEDAGHQPAGFAQAAPYLYFTVVALDGITALFSERTRILSLLNEEQQRLARALQLRWDLTQRYWSTIASFGTGRWPVEDIPWRTTDLEESDYFSLLVTAMTVQDLVGRRAPDAELSRVGRVLDELANRGRITRRAFAGDTAHRLHAPGLRLELVGSEDAGGPRLVWTVFDFSPLLLKRTIRVAGLMRDTELRGRMLAQADAIWDHLLLRRLTEAPARDLWDQPAGVFPGVGDRRDQPSWYYTERVVECLVTAANVVADAPLRADRLSELAVDLLNEADHLFDRELLGGAGDAGRALRDSIHTMRATLSRARRIVHDRPGSAVVLAGDVLRELDRLAAAREDASGTT